MFLYLFGRKRKEEKPQATCTCISGDRRDLKRFQRQTQCKERFALSLAPQHEFRSKERESVAFFTPALGEVFFFSRRIALSLIREQWSHYWNKINTSTNTEQTTKMERLLSSAEQNVSDAFLMRRPLFGLERRSGGASSECRCSFVSSENKTKSSAASMCPDPFSTESSRNCSSTTNLLNSASIIIFLPRTRAANWFLCVSQ